MPPRFLVGNARAGFQEGCERDGRMIHQPLSDPRQRLAYGNAHIAQMPDRPNAGPQQMRGGVDGARGQDDLIAPEFRGAAVHQRLDPDTAEVLEQEFGHLRVGGNRQIFPLAHVGVQIADGSGDAFFLGVGDGNREIPVLETPILVG